MDTKRKRKTFAVQQSVFSIVHYKTTSFSLCFFTSLCSDLRTSNQLHTHTTAIMSFGEFNQADTNHDNRLDAGEFRNFLTQNISGAGFGGAGGAGGAYGALGGAGGALGGASEYSSSSYESSSTGNVGAGNFGGNYGASYGSGSDLGLAAGGSSYDSSSSSSYSAGGLGAAGFGAAGLDSSLSYLSGGAGYGAASGFDASSYGASGAVGGGSYGASSNDYSSSSSTTAVQTYATDAQGLFRDSNPQVVRRPAPSGPVTYTQNIRVRFLQPPPIAPPGVSLSFHYMLSHYLSACLATHHQRSATTPAASTTPAGYSSTSTRSSSTTTARLARKTTSGTTKRCIANR